MLGVRARGEVRAGDVSELHVRVSDVKREKPEGSRRPFGFFYAGTWAGRLMI